MKLFKLDLLTLLIGLFIFSGCEPSDDVGLEIDPANAIIGTLDSSIIVKSSTIKDDSIKTNTLVKYPLGHFKDPIFGDTDASVSMSLVLPSSNLTFGTNPVLDSAVLVLRYASEFYGDSITVFDFKVHQLTGRLTQSTNYLNTESHAFNSTDEIGELRFSKINIKDSVRVSQIIVGKPNVIKNQPPQIRIKIKSAFIDSNFLKASKVHFKDNNSFNDWIKGFRVTAMPQGLKAGGIVLLDLNSASKIAEGSKLELYYRSGSDTIVKSFAIQKEVSPVAATIIHNYNKIDIKNQLSNPNVEYNYIQSMAGLLTEVSFPNLDSLKLLGNIAINKAELIIKVINDPVYDFKPAPRLYLFTKDIAGQRKAVADSDDLDSRALTDLFFGGFYSNTKKGYNFTLTSYIQDLLNDKVSSDKLYINVAAPGAKGKQAMDPFNSTTSRAVIGSGNSSESKFQMKLNIIYTKVN